MSPPPDTTGNTRGLDRWAAAVALCSIVIQGHRLGVGNQEPTIAWIRRINDPGWLARDWMMSTPPIHPVLTQPLACAVAAVGEPATFLGIQIITRILLMMGVWRLLVAMVGGVPRWVAVMAMAGIVFEPRLRLGSHYLQGGTWEAAHLGMAAAVWTIAIAIRSARGEDPWWKLGVAGGLAIFAHLFIGMPVFGICLLAVLWLRRSEAATWLSCGLLALLIGQPSWMPAAFEFFSGASGPLSPAEVVRLMQFRHPHHHMPWTWPLHHWAIAAAILALGGWAARRATPEPRTLAVPATLLAYFIASCSAFAWAAHAERLPILAFAQPFRLLSLFLLMAWLGVVAVVGRRWSVGGRRSAVGGYSTSPTTNDQRLATALSFVALLAILALQSFPALRALPNRLHPRHEYWLAEVAPPAHERDRIELCAWVRANTPKDALFSIPPTMTGFRIWEERAIIVDWKTFPYRNADLAEWKRRYGTARLAEDQSGLKTASAEHEADYLVFAKADGDWPKDATSLFECETYAVVAAPKSPPVPEP